MSKPAVLLIYTGGTIGMIRDPISGILRPFELNHLLETVPELRGFNIDLTSESFEKPIDSSDMQPSHWIKLAQLIRKHYHDYDGFVILHGSDTMAYTASALSFMLEGLEKPVVLTGSQLPIGQVRTDGRENLAGAIEIAAMKESGRTLIPEVCIFFGSRLLRGNRAVKQSTEDLEAFVSPNFEPLASAGVHWSIKRKALLLPESIGFGTCEKLSNDIGVIHIYPGMTENAINPILESPLKAIVLLTFGSGNVQAQAPWVSGIKQAVASGKIVVNITQCFSGGVVQGKYETSLSLLEAGVLSGGDMTFEAAVTKLMVLLGKYSDQREVSRLFMRNLKGERSL